MSLLYQAPFQSFLKFSCSRCSVVPGIQCLANSSCKAIFTSKDKPLKSVVSKSSQPEENILFLWILSGAHFPFHFHLSFQSWGRCAENYVLKNHQTFLVSFPFPPVAVGCQLGESDQACPALLPGDLQNFCPNYTNSPNQKRGMYTQEQWTSTRNAAPKPFSPCIRVNS